LQPGNNAKNDARARFAGKGVYPVEYAHWLVNPLRHLIFPAARLVRRLHLKSTDCVLEVGPGPGYFSPAVARRLPDGKLMLFDVQQGMLDLARARLLRRGLTNFECHLGNAGSLPFDDASFDVVFMVTVLGEVGDSGARQAALNEAARVLKPGGLVSITEQFGDPDYVRVADLEEFARNAKLTPERRFGPRYFYTYNFRKPS
jgi:uncharacterized protein